MDGLAELGLRCDDDAMQNDEEKKGVRNVGWPPGQTMNGVRENRSTEG